MIVYPLHSIDGKELGKIVLEDNEIPNLIMGDVTFMLGGAYHLNSKQFMNFILIPKEYNRG